MNCHGRRKAIKSKVEAIRALEMLAGHSTFFGEIVKELISYITRIVCEVSCILVYISIEKPFH